MHIPCMLCTHLKYFTYLRCQRGSIYQVSFNMSETRKWLCLTPMANATAFACTYMHNKSDYFWGALIRVPYPERLHPVMDMCFLADVACV